MRADRDGEAERLEPGSDGDDVAPDQRAEHHEEGEGQHREGAADHVADRFEPRQPPGPGLAQAVGAVEPDPQALDAARTRSRAPAAAPRVRTPPRCSVSTRCTSPTMGLATSRGQASKISTPASSASDLVPNRPASAASRIRNGNSEVRTRESDMARDRPAVMGDEALGGDGRRPRGWCAGGSRGEGVVLEGAGGQACLLDAVAWRRCSARRGNVRARTVRRYRVVFDAAGDACLRPSCPTRPRPVAAIPAAFRPDLGDRLRRRPLRRSPCRAADLRGDPRGRSRAGAGGHRRSPSAHAGRAAAPAGAMPSFAGVLMQGIYVIGVFWSVQHGLPAGIAALVGSLQPLLTAMLAGPLLGETRQPAPLVRHRARFRRRAPRPGAEARRRRTAGIPVAALAACLGAMVAMTLGTLWQKRHAAGRDLLSNAAIQFVGGPLSWPCRSPSLFGDRRLRRVHRRCGSASPGRCSSTPSAGSCCCSC